MTTVLCVGTLILCVCASFVFYACCVAAGRADDIEEARDGIRRS